MEATSKVSNLLIFRYIVVVHKTSIYFEGTFSNDHLAGGGIAFLQNGSYFEGELTLFGPNGKGIIFLPNSELKSEVSNFPILYKFLVVSLTVDTIL